MALSETSNLLVRISAQNQTDRAFAELKRGLDGIASTAVKVAGVIAAALAFKDVIDTTRRLGDEIDTLRDNLGITAEQASLLNFQARAMGSSAEEVSSAFGALNRKLIDQLPLLEKGESDFDKWGVTVRNASGDILPFQDVLRNVSKRLTELPAGFARSGAAMDLLGRSGRQLIDLLTASDGEIAALNREAQELGLVLSDAGVDSLEQFNREMNRMGLAFDAIKLRLGQAILPLLRAFADGLRTAAGAIKSLGEALRTPLGILKEFADRMASFSEAIRKEGFGPAIAKLAEDLIKKVGEILGTVGSWVSENLPKWIEATKKLFEGMIDWIRLTGWPSLVTFIETKVPEFANWIVKSLPEWTKNLGELITKFVQWWLGTGVPTIAVGFATVTSKIGGWLLDAIGWMSHVGIPAATSTLLAIGGAILKGIVEGLGDLKTKIWNWIKDAVPMAAEIESFLRSKFPGQDGNLNQPGGPIGPPNAPTTPTQPWIPGIDKILPKRGAGDLAGVDREGNAGWWTPGAQFIAAANGFHGMVDKPTMFMAGEAGSESVDISPGGRRSGGISIGTIVINGNVDSRERVDEVVNAVAERLMSLAGGLGPLGYR